MVGGLLPAVQEVLVPRAEANLAAWLARSDAAEAPAPAAAGAAGSGLAGDAGGPPEGGEASPTRFSSLRRRSSALRRASSPMQSLGRSPPGSASPMTLMGRRSMSSPALKKAAESVAAAASEHGGGGPESWGRP